MNHTIEHTVAWGETVYFDNSLSLSTQQSV